MAEKTVYLQFETKSALLKEVVETAIVGDDDAIPAADRDWFHAVVDQTELDQKLRQLVDATSALHERSGAVFAMARGCRRHRPRGRRPVGVRQTRPSGRHDPTGPAPSKTDQLPAGLDIDWVPQLCTSSSVPRAGIWLVSNSPRPQQYRECDLRLRDAFIS